MNRVRVLIVDDSAMMRSFLRETLSEHPGIEVVGTAPDPATARQKIKLLNPDVLTLDIEMPGMDGLTFLEHLMRLRPMPVVMVSSLTQKGAGATLRSLELGAADFVAKPLGGIESAWPGFQAEIIRKILSAAGSKAPIQYPEAEALQAFESGGPGKIVAVGGSTGSVSVIQHILAAMPANGPAMLIAVHMPPLFTRQYAARLDGLCRMSVVEAEDGLPIAGGRAYIAPGDRHMTVRKQGSHWVCALEQGPRVNGHIPSVDVMMESVAMNLGSGAIGILLSGMGRDGAIGLKAMRDAGALTAVQDEASSIIYGMPGAAVAIGAATTELDALAIPSYILEHAAEESLPLKRTAP